MADRAGCTASWRFHRTVTHYCHKQAFMRRFPQPGGDEWLCWMHRAKRWLLK